MDDCHVSLLVQLEPIVERLVTERDTDYVFDNKVGFSLSLEGASFFSSLKKVFIAIILKL